jgi:hypothetical protein
MQLPLWILHIHFDSKKENWVPCFSEYGGGLSMECI